MPFTSEGFIIYFEKLLIFYQDQFPIFPVLYTVLLGLSWAVKKQQQAAWLLRALSCIDLTTLAGDDTPGNVIRLCAKARQPVRQDLLDSLGVGKLI